MHILFITLLLLLVNCGPTEEITTPMVFRPYEYVQIEDFELKLTKVPNAESIQLLVGDIADDSGGYFTTGLVNYSYPRWIQDDVIDIAVLDNYKIAWKDLKEVTIDKQAERYSKIIAFLKTRYKKVSCYGHGVGGLELAYFVQQVPNSCDNLIISGGSLIPNTLAVRGKIEALLKQEKHFWYNIDVYRELNYGPKVEDFINEYEIKRVRSGSLARVLILFSFLDTPIIHSIPVPTLLLTGADSRLVSPMLLEENKKRFPNVTAYVQPDAGHSLHFHASRFHGWRTISAWLKEN